MNIIKKIKKYISCQLNPLSPLEQQLANHGERLVPKVITDPEVIRHKSSYVFFKKIIDLDRKFIQKTGIGRSGSLNKKITILDLGCGVGHGCFTLSKIKGAEITGIDNSQEAIDYANKNFRSKNIKYRVSDLTEYLKQTKKYDYIVSRGVLEHITNGLDIAKKSSWRNRLIFDVPYNEKPGPNPYHLITKITESSLASFQFKELFYEDLEGKIFNQKTKPTKPNMILCVSSTKILPLVSSYKIKFPLPAWQGNKLDF